MTIFSTNPPQIILPIVQLRDVLLWNKPMDWTAWLGSMAAGALVCAGGFAWFQKMRIGFADVL